MAVTADMVKKSLILEYVVETAAEANTLMDTIISQNVFETKDGDLASKSGAYIVDRERTEIEL